ALTQPVAGLSRRAAALGARRGARLARTPLFSDVRGLSDGVDGRHHITRSHDEGYVRARRAADRHLGGPNNAAVARGIPHGVGLCACRGGAHPHRRGAASTHSQAPPRDVAASPEFVGLTEFLRPALSPARAGGGAAPTPASSSA